MRKDVFIETANRVFPEAEVTEATVNKSYGSYEGVTIRMNGNAIAPTFNPETLPEELTDEEFEEIVTRALAEAPQIDPENVLPSFEDADIRLKVCPVTSPLNESNGGIGKTVEDITVIPYVNLGQSLGAMASVTLTKGILDQWGKTFDEVYEAANTEDYRVSDMESVIGAMMGMGEEPGLGIGNLKELPVTNMMYVIGNTTKINGAAAMLCTPLMNELREVIGDFYVLPSSVHEVLAVPMSSGSSAEELQKMVTDVNDTQVDPVDRLSYSVYKYTGEGLSVACPSK